MGRSFILAVSLAAGIASVRSAAAQTCGNFVREGSEQCDDGNTRNLDGCDSTCHFEQTHRLTALKLQASAGTCAGDAFGAAFAGLALTQIQTSIDNSIGTGSTSVLLHFLSLDDLLGNNDPALQVGVLSGRPILPGSTAYNGTSDRDWWYAADPGMTDAQHVPVFRLSGFLSAGHVSVGPGNATINLTLGTQPTPVAFSSLAISLPVGPVSVPASLSPPAASTAGRAPGHEPYEHLDPGLISFDTGGVANTNWGTLCGNVGAASLAAVTVPAALQTGAPTACAQGYTAANSLLDVLVGGCTVFGIPVVSMTQPDQGDPSAPDAGAGPPYTLIANNGSRIIDTCHDHNGAPVDLVTCLTDAGFSSSWKITSDRVIVGDDRLLADGFESGTLAAWSSASTDGGDLSVTPDAALDGTTKGLQGVVNDTNSLFVRDDGPVDENHYRARFWLDPHAFDPGEASGHFRTRIFIGFEENPTRRVFAIVLKRQGGVYSVMGRARRDDGTQADTGFVSLDGGNPAAPHELAVEWIRSSGLPALDGIFRFTLDGTTTEINGLANAASSIDFVRLGALSVKGGANGTVFWDEFASTRRGPTP